MAQVAIRPYKKEPNQKDHIVPLMDNKIKQLCPTKLRWLPAEWPPRFTWHYRQHEGILRQVDYALCGGSSARLSTLPLALFVARVCVYSWVSSDQIKLSFQWSIHCVLCQNRSHTHSHCLIPEIIVARHVWRQSPHQRSSRYAMCFPAIDCLL